MNSNWFAFGELINNHLAYKNLTITSYAGHKQKKNGLLRNEFSLEQISVEVPSLVGNCSGSQPADGGTMRQKELVLARLTIPPLAPLKPCRQEGEKDFLFSVLVFQHQRLPI